MDVRHIKITSVEGLYRINDKKAFKGLIVRPSIQTKTYNGDQRKRFTVDFSQFCTTFSTLLLTVPLSVSSVRSWFSFTRRTHWRSISRKWTPHCIRPLSSQSKVTHPITHLITHQVEGLYLHPEMRTHNMKWDEVDVFNPNDYPRCNVCAVWKGAACGLLV